MGGVVWSEWLSGWCGVIGVVEWVVWCGLSF